MVAAELGDRVGRVFGKEKAVVLTIALSRIGRLQQKELRFVIVVVVAEVPCWRS